VAKEQMDALRLQLERDKHELNRALVQDDLARIEGSNDDFLAAAGAVESYFKPFIAVTDGASDLSRGVKNTYQNAYDTIDTWYDLGFQPIKKIGGVMNDTNKVWGAGLDSASTAIELAGMLG
jgi:hypothetical protein